MSELHQASAAGDVSAVEEILLYNQCDPNQRDIDWCYKTPLHWAAAGGHTEMVELLLAHGARACLQTELGWTPAHFAAEGGHLGVLQLLHVHHAPLDKPDRCGDTPAHIADVYGQRECALFLRNAELECKAYRRTAATKGLKLDEDDEGWSPDGKKYIGNTQ